MLTKAKSQSKTEYVAFRLSSLLVISGKNQLKDDDLSWISVFSKKDREQLKSELYDAISKAIQDDNWVIKDDAKYKEINERIGALHINNANRN